ncbi:MAG: spermidine synthase [Candidatus Limnocylindrales bacterium]
MARNDVRLFLTSLAILFVELMLIRWIPANVKYIGFFSNFLLIASFLGIGLGILLGRRGGNPRLSPFAFLLAAVVAFVYGNQLNVQVDSQNELFFGLAENQAADLNFLVLPFVVALVVALMATLALPLGGLLKSMPPLRAYAIDIFGSMVGIAAFTTLSALGTDPVIWFSVGVALVVALELGRKITFWTFINGAALAAVLAFVIVGSQGKNDIWSPYYRINSFKVASGLEHLTVDGIPHQALHPLGEQGIEEFYEQVYRWFPGRTYDNVLIVGAGSGSDVAIALAHGAGHVDAVEIDPKLQQIGRERHPNQPYSDSRVTGYVNDGRAFLRTTDKKYDLIIFALPDSLTLVSQQSSVRLESFLFTEEAFATVRNHLTDQGIFVVYNYYRDNWLVSKLSTMLDDAFDNPPLVAVYGAHKAALANGPLVASLPNGVPPGDVNSVTGPPALTDGGPVAKPATDNWPFLYLRTPFIASHYLAAIAIVLLGALVAVAVAAFATGTTIRKFSPHFFVLGVAFLLLETRSITSFSLLFGTTWLVNSLTFFAILASVLLAIFVNARWPIKRATPYYMLLFVAIAIAFVLPPESLLFDPPWLRYIVAAVLAFAPVFIANLVFSYSFRDTNTADMAFASNLLGAMVGGMLEYLALITGYQALLLIVAALYGLAWLFATRLRLGADRELADADGVIEVEQGAQLMPAPTQIPPQPAG